MAQKEKTAKKKMSAKQLEAKLASFRDKCGEDGRFPSEAGLILFLGISESYYEQLRDDPEYELVFERARLYRVDWLENKMVTDPKAAAGCMNALRQEQNGGYKDRNANNAGKHKKLILELKNVGAGACD